MIKRFIRTKMWGIRYTSIATIIDLYEHVLSRVILSQTSPLISERFHFVHPAYGCFVTMAPFVDND